MELILNSSMRYVLIADARIVDLFVSNYCDYEVVMDPTLHMPSYTVYFRPDWNLSRTLHQSHISLIEQEHHFLQLKYHAIPVKCDHPGDELVFSDLLPTLSLLQMNGAFLSLVFAEIAATVALGIEVLWELATCHFCYIFSTSIR